LASSMSSANISRCRQIQPPLIQAALPACRHGPKSKPCVWMH
jgi:hypothetical protein